MRKAINFDVNTKRYKKYTNKKAPMAYIEIREFFNKNGFEHRQGSGYISSRNLNNMDIATLIKNMTLELNWLKYCVKQIDVTNIGKQYSLIDIINKVPIDNGLHK